MTDLFPNLPRQDPPDILIADHHMLSGCPVCFGRGQLRPLPPFKLPRDCSHCGGAGKVLRRIEGAIHV